MNIILIAYKIEKDKGSEDGCGYHIARRLIKAGDNVILISRVNNIENLKRDPNFNGVNLIGIDVPKPLSYIKKKGRGIILYYYLWQWFVGRLVNQLQDQQPVDVIHQLNFHADWAPHFITKKTAKIIYGPINHHSYIPTDFQFGFKPLTIVMEWVKNIAKLFFWYCDPFVKRTAQSTDVILYGNENIAPPYKKMTHKTRVMPYGGSVLPICNKKDLSHPFNVLFVGRFVNLKGCIPAIDAFAQFVKSSGSNAVMNFIGQGVLEDTIKERADFHGIAAQVRFLPWMEQKDLIKHYQSAHVFLYPSFEAQGLVVSEALSSGCPVICLANTGPAYLLGDAGLNVQQKSYAETVNALTQKLETVYTAFCEGKPYQILVDKAVERYQTHLTWDVITDRIREEYYDG